MSDYRVNLNEFYFFPSSFEAEIVKIIAMNNLEKSVSHYKTTRPIRHMKIQPRT